MHEHEHISNYDFTRFHVLMQCLLYADLRQKMSNDVLHFNANLSFLSDADKFVSLFSNENVFTIVAKTCYNISIRRNSFFYTISYCVNIILYSFKMLYFIEYKSLINLFKIGTCNMICDGERIFYYVNTCL